ncbi:MAG: hypothetical protein ACK4TI_02270 [Nitrososphaerales archaeon]
MNNLRSRDKVERLVRRSPTSLPPKLCPKCLKPLKPLSQLSGWFAPEYYYCDGCGYSGVVALESVEDEDND